MQPSVYASKELTSLLTNLSEVVYKSLDEALTMVARLLFIEFDEHLLEQLLLPVWYCQGNCHRKQTTRLATSPTATELLQHVALTLVSSSKRKGMNYCVNIGCVLERYLAMNARERDLFPPSFLNALFHPSCAIVMRR